MLKEEQEALLHDEKKDFQIGTEKSFWKSIRNYCKLPQLCDWIIVGVLIVCTVATIIIICV
jgi:hypothetical protein